MFPDIKCRSCKINHISIGNLNERTNASTQIKNRTQGMCFGRKRKRKTNGNLARPNNGAVNANLLDDGFSGGVCPRGRLFRDCSRGRRCGHPQNGRQQCAFIRRTRSSSSFDVQRIRRGRCRWNDERHEVLLRLKVVEEKRRTSLGLECQTEMVEVGCDEVA